MSSFIVSQECMNNIINGLFWNHEFKQLYGYILEKAGYTTCKDFQRLGEELYSLNARGTGQRYNDNQMLYTLIKFDWKDNSSVNEWQVLMSIQCLRYQCCEGDTDEQELYKFTENSNFLSHKNAIFVTNPIGIRKAAKQGKRTLADAKKRVILIKPGNTRKKGVCLL